MILARFLLLWSLGLCLMAQSAVEVLEARTIDKLKQFAASADGVLAVAAMDLTTGRAISVHGGAVLAQASVIKVPILWRTMEAVDAGKLNLDERYTLQPSEAVGGSGGLQKLLQAGPVTLSLSDLIRKMIEDSDNTATNKVISLVGMDNVNRSMIELGLKNTRLQRIMMDVAAAQASRENTSTASEMARLLQLVWQAEQKGAPAGLRMVEWLKLVPGEVRKALPGVAVAAKTGELPGVRNEAAIVYLPRRPYVVVVLNAFQSGETNATGAIVRILHDHFTRLATANDYGNAVWRQ